MKRKELINFNLSAVFIALGLILPFLTGQIQQIGTMLLPMHIPVLLCGLICGWKYGLFIGFILPPLRSVIFGMPPMFPTAIAMAFELATYGVVIGFLYQRSNKKSVASVYRSMIGAMISGRIVWGSRYDGNFRNKRKHFYLEDVYSGSIFKCYTRNYPAASPYSFYYGNT